MAHTLDDFRKMYEGCFVFLDETNLALFSMVINDNQLELQTDETGTILLPTNESSFTRIDHRFPERGLYNINDRAYLFQRIAARQWKRAPCTKNTSIKSLLYCIEQEWTITPSLNLDTMAQLFSPKYFSIKEALLLPNLYSRALSLSLAVSISNTTKYDALLWFNSKAIGYLDHKDKTIILKDPLFREEVIDYLHTSEPSWNLTVQLQ